MAAPFRFPVAFPLADPQTGQCACESEPDGNSLVMSTIKIEVPAAPNELFDVLADGWMYSGWVVGASHIRDVDETWPEVGAQVHHTVGAWPLTISDTTTVVEMEPNRLLVLDARALPAGRASVRIEFHPAGPGRTRVEMTEHLSGGPAALVPSPVTDPLLSARNRESVHRLADIAVGWRTDPHHHRKHEPVPAH
jgi:hypothetical protein